MTSGRGAAQATAEALADPYPSRHGYAADPYAAPRSYGEPDEYSEPSGYQAARGLLYAVPNEPAQDYRAEPEPDPRYYAESVREAAEQEAAAIRQQAADQAAALTRQASEEAAKIREAAAKEAAEFRATMQAMQGELGRVAAYVTDNLTVPAIPAARPAEAPVTRPALPPAQPEELAPPEQLTRPVRPARPERQARPATRPAQRPAPSRPAQEPDRKQSKRPRQYNAMLVSRFAVAAGILAAIAAGTAELAVHGPSFFVFRQGGAGETPGFKQTDQQFQAAQHPKPAPKPAAPKHAATTPAPKSTV